MPDALGRQRTGDGASDAQQIRDHPGVFLIGLSLAQEGLAIGFHLQRVEDDHFQAVLGEGVIQGQPVMAGGFQRDLDLSRESVQVLQELGESLPGVVKIASNIGPGETLLGIEILDAREEEISK